MGLSCGLCLLSACLARDLPGPLKPFPEPSHASSQLLVTTFYSFQCHVESLPALAFDLSQSLLSWQMVLVERRAVDWAHYRTESGKAM